MHDYAMFSRGDRVLVAVSGGLDSLVLATVLHLWQLKSPVKFTLEAVHIDHGFWRKSGVPLSPQKSIGDQLRKHSISLRVEPEWKFEGQKRSCYLCARNRRSQLFDLARIHGYQKIALGHHKDDLIETFMLNAIYSGNISTMLPRQKLFDDTLSIVRPMAYLEKAEIIELASGLGLHPVANLCPLADETRRERVRGYLETIYQDQPTAKSSLFAALSNIRKEYLL
jgi:tRNA 2-thiocytidine biosynthesis protein TtcA